MRLFDELAAAGMSPPTLDQLSAAYGADMIRALIRSGELVQVSPNLVFTAEALQQIKHQIRQRVDGAGPFTVADFRDLVATSRKYAVPLLEYLDGIGYTTRRGDLRSLGSKA
jgi:selenocysteine-specific elongation factor